MSVATEIARIKQATNDLKDVIASKGVDIPEGTKIDEIPDIVDINLFAGGGGDISEYIAEETISNGSSTYNWLFQLVKKIKTVKITGSRGLQYAFNKANYLEEVEEIINEGTGSSASNMFYGCSRLKYIPWFNSSNITSFSYFAYGCSLITSFPALDMSRCTGISQMCYNCTNLQTIPELNFSMITNAGDAFTMCTNLTNLGGFINYGSNFSTSMQENYPYYKLYLAASNNLTEQSIINVLNGLYDIRTKGCNNQSVVFGATNLAKLTSTEGQQALADAQAKGWLVS